MMPLFPLRNLGGSRKIGSGVLLCAGYAVVPLMIMVSSIVVRGLATTVIVHAMADWSCRADFVGID